MATDSKFQTHHQQLIIDALDQRHSANQRTRAKQPRFAPVIDKEQELIRETQAIVRDWAPSK